MSIVSKSSPVVVRPSATEMSTCNVVSLSPFDRGLESPVIFFVVFDRPIHKPAETIQTALSLALVHYFPFAGRLSSGAANDGDDLSIRCTAADGALFVAASAGCTLEEAKLLEQSPAGRRETTTPLNELAVDYPAKGCGHDDPLLMVQVTEFSCGGFVVGVTWNHAVADGAGTAQFLQALGELARGRSAPSVVPVRCDDSIPSLPPLMAAGRQLMVSLEPQDFASLDITIPSSFINRVRAEYLDGERSSSNDGRRRRPCTVFEVVTAVLWQRHTRVAISNPYVPSLLCFTADVRKHVGTKDGYYGNCVIGQLVMAPTSRAVANGNLVDLIEMIQHAKEEIPNMLRMEVEEGRGGNSLPAGTRLEQLCDMVQHNNNVLSVSCMWNIGFEDVDFGGGTPARVTCRSLVMSLPFCVPCLPCKGTDGASVLARFVKEEQVDAFLAELAKFT